MALERGIALTVFVIGLAVVLLSLVGCGVDGDEAPAGTCGDRNFALPVVGAEMTEDGGSVRFAYAGGEPCSFAVDRHEGRLYVELRSEADPDRKAPFPSGCADEADCSALPEGQAAFVID